MPHRDFFPDRAQVDEGLQPLSTEFHDVLVIPPRHKQGGGDVVDGEKFFRVPVVKVKRGTGPDVGLYDDPPELWDKTDTGQRKVIGIAHPEDVDVSDTDRSERGPVFAAMAVKAEPGASSCATCYLVDAHNLTSPNVWTAEEWDAPLTENLPAAAGADAKEAEVLLALSRGIVLRFKVSGLDQLEKGVPSKTSFDLAEGVHYEIEPVQLKREVEIWNQLRNGTVAGRVLYRALQGDKSARILPLVNVTSLRGGSR
jgi:hypothetical protein